MHSRNAKMLPLRLPRLRHYSWLIHQPVFSSLHFFRGLVRTRQTLLDQQLFNVRPAICSHRNLKKAAVSRLHLVSEHRTGAHDHDEQADTQAETVR